MVNVFLANSHLVTAPHSTMLKRASLRTEPFISNWGAAARPLGGAPRTAYGPARKDSAAIIRGTEFQSAPRVIRGAERLSDESGDIHQ